MVEFIKSLFEETRIVSLVEAVTKLGWLAFAFCVFLSLRRHLSDLIPRLKKGKVLGQEFELRESIDDLRRSVGSVVAETEAGPQTVETTAMANPIGPVDELTRLEKQILSDAARSPTAALLTLANAMEHRLLHLLGAMGWLPKLKVTGLPDAVDLLEEKGVISRSLASSARIFWKARNALVHGIHAPDEEILKAIDLGITLLRAIYVIRASELTVLVADIPIFSDSEGRNRIEGAVGVMLEEASPGRMIRGTVVYPTTRTWYKPGMRVTLESSKGRTFGEVWYRDPSSDRIVQACKGSLEFTGRNVEDL